MPNRSPDIVGLLTNRIDHLETNLTGQIHDVRSDLGGRMDDLNARVAIQNGRVGKLETCVAKMEAEVEADLNKPAMDKRKVALIGGSGVVGGAALLELLRIIGDSLHKAGYLG